MVRVFQLELKHLPAPDKNYDSFSIILSYSQIFATRFVNSYSIGLLHAYFFHAKSILTIINLPKVEKNNSINANSSIFKDPTQHSKFLHVTLGHLINMLLYLPNVQLTETCSSRGSNLKFECS